MLRKIGNEVKESAIIMAIVYMIMAIIDNRGIDHYLLEDYILGENFSVFLILVGLALGYKLAQHIYRILATAFKNDIDTIKGELNKGKVNS